MALRSKLSFVLLGVLAPVFGSAIEFVGSDRVMDVMIRQLARAQAALDSGDFKTANAYTEAVLMDREERVFLDTSYVGRDTANNAQVAFKAAMQIWSDSLPNATNFTFVTSAKEADVVVEFSPQVVSEGLNVAGNIHWWRSLETDASGNPHASTRAVIRVRTERPGSSEPMSFELMRHTCAHEIGHLLGLGDSYRTGDLMGPLDLRAPVCKLSDTELQAMREMREQATRLRALAMTTAFVSR